MVQFGWCTNIEKASLLEQAGYDYIECPVTSLKLEDEEAHKKALLSYKNSPLPVRAFNVFFSGDIRIVGPDVDKSQVRSYVEKAANALQKIGSQTAVLGSGRSRNIPEGWSHEQAEEQFLELLNWIADDFTGAGLTLAIEPLNRRESNLINSVSEAVQFAQQINRESVRVLADFYHMQLENEPLHTLIEHKDWLSHIHLADTNRSYPSDGEYPYDEFFKILNQAGYRGNLSVECNAKGSLEELTSSLQFLKDNFE